MKYLKQDTLKRHNTLSFYPRSAYKIDANKIMVSADDSNFTLSWKDFITFCIETKSKRNRKVSKDKELHKNEYQLC